MHSRRQLDGMNGAAVVDERRVVCLAATKSGATARSGAVGCSRRPEAAQVWAAMAGAPACARKAKAGGTATRISAQAPAAAAMREQSGGGGQSHTSWMVAQQPKTKGEEETGQPTHKTPMVGGGSGTPFHVMPGPGGADQEGDEEGPVLMSMARRRRHTHNTHILVARPHPFSPRPSSCPLPFHFHYFHTQEGRLPPFRYLHHPAFQPVGGHA